MPPRRLLLRGARVCDPVNRIDGEVLDVLLDGGRVAAVGRGLEAGEARIVALDGLVVAPGFIDMHVHLREPGDEESETIESGLRAAVAGGFTAVAAMANTRPVNDAPEVTERILARASGLGLARLHPLAAATRGLEGRELTDFAALKGAGAIGLSDDGKPFASSELLRRTLERALALEMIVSDHCEDPTLAPGWSMNEGALSGQLGRTGQPGAGEEIQVARDAVLARLLGARLHCAHVSARGSIERLREEKARGTRISAEVTPHHFTLTEQAVQDFGADAKMNPPLRSAEDLAAVLGGLRDGTIDCIATDHAPHAAGKKGGAFEGCANGVVGLETAVALALDRLLHGGVVALSRLVELMSVHPARLLGVEGGSLAPSRPADVTVLDLEACGVIDPARFRSRSRNTPFAGMKLRGRAAATLVGGRVVYSTLAKLPEEGA